MQLCYLHPTINVQSKNVHYRWICCRLWWKHCQIPPPPHLRQIRCTVAQISPLPPSKPSCDWWPTSSLIVAAYRAGRGAAGVVHCGRQPWDNSCTGGRKSQQSEQDKFTQGEARWGLTSIHRDAIGNSASVPRCERRPRGRRADSAAGWFLRCSVEVVTGGANVS